MRSTKTLRTKKTFRRNITKPNIERIFNLPDINLLLVEEGQCEAICWGDNTIKRSKTIAFIIKDFEVNKGGPTFQLKVCSLCSPSYRYNILSIRYYFHIDVNPTELSISTILSCLNLKNSHADVRKYSLIGKDENGFRFCSSIRCHVNDTKETLDCYRKYRKMLFDSAYFLIRDLFEYCYLKKDIEFPQMDRLNEYDNHYPLSILKNRIDNK